MKITNTCSAKVNMKPDSVKCNTHNEDTSAV